MKVFFTILSIVLLASCTTTKNEKSQYYGLPKSKSDLQFLTIKGEIETDSEQFSGSLATVFDIAGKDSLRLELFGPFGFQVAKLYSNETEFVAFNMFQNIAYKGNPKKNSLEAVFDINLEFSDLMSFARSEIPGDPLSFKFEEVLENGNKLFKSKQKKGFVEFVILDNSKNIIQYQQLDSDGNTSLNVFFNNYSIWQDYSFAEEVIIKFGEMESVVKITNEEFLFPDKFDRLSFDLPKETEVQSIGK